MRLWIWTILMLVALTGTAAFAQPTGSTTSPVVSDDQVLMATFRLVDEGLRSSSPVRSSHVLPQVAQATGRSENDVRSHLLSKLEALEDLRQEKGAGWDHLRLRKGDLSHRQLSRLMEHLGESLTRILSSSDDYLLDTNLRWAARSARIPPEEALEFLRRLLTSQLSNDPLAKPVEPVGVVVTGWTERYDFKLEPLLLFLDTDDEAEATEAVRDIQRFIVPGVVRGLTSVPGIAWAFRQRDLTALVDPVYDIRIRARKLSFSGLTTNLQPCIDVGVDVVDTESDRSVYFKDIDHCAVDASGEQRLLPFFSEVAHVVVDSLAPFFSTFR